MDYPRRDANAVGGGMTALLIALGFVAILLVAFGVTGALRNSEPAAVTTPVVKPEPAPAAPATPPAATTAPATELPPVKEPDVPTRSEQPNDAVDTAPATPPQSEPGKPSPNVPAPAPAP